MTYLLLNTVFLVVAGGITVVALWLRPGFRHHLPAIGVALVAVLVLTALFDNVMIGIGLVDYDPNRINGLRLGLAPIEDFAYPVAAALLLPALWALLGRTDD
ncbi:lycopene cyclase domain-containing protein [Cryobacterium sp. PH31-AA6]|uniref:lycopene cyclase domain-containing protein n=1 Tax=Cryobacterium sp. PH31-AA6 TaxID=3046205 RepID=UPI0024BA7538|nr:lycopene cyclase domain-containing protein [Cryobacterium sp. PH31-AA6]MDJ0323546.1 lycopene cyclase domain-containing protein [Cryobacterium sp. PH31-AA6]